MNKILLKGVILVCIIICFTGCEATGYNKARGTYMRTNSNENVLIQDELQDNDKYKYVYLINHTGKKDIFEDLKTGDLIEITYVIMQENEDKITTEIWDLKKINGY